MLSQKALQELRRVLLAMIFYQSFTTWNYTVYNVLESILCVIVVDGNILTLICFISSNKLRQQKYALICSLASSDLLVGFVKISVTLWLNFGGSLEKCITYNQFVVVFSIEGSTYFVSLSHLIMIGIDRPIAVMFPLRYASLITRKVVVTMISISWVIPLMFVIYKIISVLPKEAADCIETEGQQS